MPTSRGVVCRSLVFTVARDPPFVFFCVLSCVASRRTLLKPSGKTIVYFSPGFPQPKYLLHVCMPIVWPTRTEGVCVLHIKPLLLPVDIQHNQCPCRFFNSKKNTSSVATILRHRCYFATRYQVCSKNKAAYGMPCHRTGYDRHDIDIPRKKEGKQRRKGPY